MTDEAQLDALGSVREWLIEDGWTPELLPDGRTFSFVYDGKNSELFVYVYIPTAIDILVVYCGCPFDIPDDTMDAAREFVARANYGMLVGCMELNVEDGDLRFRSGLDFRGISLTPDLFRNVLRPSPYGMDRYLPAIRALVIEQKSAVEALEVIDVPHG